jgi:hypothetical protein
MVKNYPAPPVIRRIMPTIIADNEWPMVEPSFSIAKLRTRALDRLVASGMTYEDALAQINSK